MSNIVIVDDEQVILLFLESILKKLGHTIVKKCNSGEMAIEAANQIKPDLIFMDINMPGKYNGIEASKVIADTCSIPVIFITAYENEEFINEIKNVGPYGYILKPFRESEIKIAINITMYREEMENKLKKAIIKYKTQLKYEEKINFILTIINSSLNPIEKLDFVLDEFRADLELFDIILLENSNDLLKPKFCVSNKIDKDFTLNKSSIINNEKTNCNDLSDPIFKLSDNQPNFISYFSVETNNDLYAIIVLIHKGDFIIDDEQLIYIKLFANALSILYKRSNDYKELNEIKENNFELEKMSIRNQRLSSLGKLSSAIAHEINQPLQSIKILSDSVLFWEKENKNVEKNIMLENFSKISSRVDRINVIIETMRYMVMSPEKIQSKEININTRLIDLIKSYDDKVPKYNIEIIPELDKSMPLFNFSDVQFDQIISNIINNAISVLSKDQNNNSKKIVIKTINNTDHCLIEIIDNGPGIPDNEKELIFNPFYSSFHNSKNLGLGLYIVFNILKIYDSSIKVVDTELRGTTFQIRLKKS